MKIAVIGANGKSGTLVVCEAVERGHEVTAIMRQFAMPFGWLWSWELFYLCFRQKNSQ